MTNAKTTKRALGSSILALVLCFAMLLGTTYAWFTDSVTSANNVIKSGNLDIELEYWDGDSWENVQNVSTILTNELWEPGVTEVAYFRIANAGSLALKYQLGINIVSETAGKNVAGNEFLLSDYIQFGVKTISADADKKPATYASREAAVAAVEALEADDLGAAKKISAGYTKATYMESGKELYLALVVWMPTDVGNEANHNGTDVPEINLGINIFATQMTAESDSFGNKYDEFAGLPWDGETVTENLTADANGVYHITSAADLVAMMNDSKYPNCNTYQNVVLECDINLGGKEVSGFGDDSGFFDGIFDGQGYTISNFKIDATNRTYYAGLFNQVSQYSGENTVIKNLTVANATVIGTSQVGVIAGGMNGNTIVDNCKVINCTAIGVKKVGSIVGYTAGGTVKDCYAENSLVLYSEKEGGEILGYQNTGSTVSNNSANNVSVNQGVAVSTADELSNSLKAGGYIILINDITMAANWTPVKVDKSTVLDGNGHTIFDMTIPQANADNEGGSALISWNTAPLTVNNLNFDGASVTGGNADGWSFAAVLVSRNWGELIVNNCKFTDCTVNGDSAHAALVCGYAYNANVTVTNCVIDKCDVTTANGNATAMVGLTNGHDIILDGNTVTNSEFTGEKEGKSGILIGTVNAGSEVTANNNTVSGNIVYGIASDKLIGRSV